MTIHLSTSPIIVALDVPNLEMALSLADELDPKQCRLKVGKELFTRSGPEVLTQLQQRGFELFLDLKFHDIPNTVARACAVAADLGVWMVNVHVSGGMRMLEAARRAVDLEGSGTLLIGVTVLTSMEREDLVAIGLDVDPLEQVMRLSRLAHAAGLDGVVCSSREAVPIRQALGSPFALVCPGIRPATASKDDQRRTMTPLEAMQAGVDWLVIGRPITEAAQPAKQLAAVLAEMGWR
jgi:orotidine-5'-phosphate decarboxylase